MKLEFTRNDLPENVRIASIILLNRQLADSLDLGLQAKQAHWNVKGPHFLTLHGLFDDTAEEIETFSDLLAERAVQLGGVAEGTAQVITRESRLPVYSLDLYRGADHVRALADAIARFAASTRAAIASAETAGDADTADILTEVSRAADVMLWKVESHIQEAWDQRKVERAK